MPDTGRVQIFCKHDEKLYYRIYKILHNVGILLTLQSIS